MIQITKELQIKEPKIISREMLKMGKGTNEWFWMDEDRLRRNHGPKEGLRFSFKELKMFRAFTSSSYLISRPLNFLSSWGGPWKRSKICV